VGIKVFSPQYELPYGAGRERRGSEMEKLKAEGSKLKGKGNFLNEICI